MGEAYFFTPCSPQCAVLNSYRITEHFQAEESHSAFIQTDSSCVNPLGFVNFFFFFPFPAVQQSVIWKEAIWSTMYLF